ncbi:hypothetical protein D3C85_1242520 [compost metagenome]
MGLIVEEPQSVLHIRTRFVEEQPLGKVMIEGQFQRLAIARLRIGHATVELFGCFIGEPGRRIEPGQ